MQSFNQPNMTFPCSSWVINMQLIGNWNTPISCLQSLCFPTVKMLSEHLMFRPQSAEPPEQGERGTPLSFGRERDENIVGKLCKVCSRNQAGSWSFGCAWWVASPPNVGGKELPGNQAFETVGFALSTAPHSSMGLGTLIPGGSMFDLCPASSLKPGLWLWPAPCSSLSHSSPVLSVGMCPVWNIKAAF